jgi:hypothetical protein
MLHPTSIAGTKKASAEDHFQQRAYSFAFSKLSIVEK